MATHSNILSRRIPWTEELGGLQSTGSQRVGQKQLIHPSTHPIHLSIWVPNRKMHKGDKRQLTKEIEMTKNLENLNVSRTQRNVY